MDRDIEVDVSLRYRGTIPPLVPSLHPVTTSNDFRRMLALWSNANREDEIDGDNDGFG